MPLTLDIPEGRISPTTVRIEGFSVDPIHGDSGVVVRVRFSKGVVVGGVYQTLESLVETLDTTPALLARINDPLAGGKSLYDEIKAVLYDMLLSAGHISAGTVT